MVSKQVQGVGLCLNHRARHQSGSQGRVPLPAPALTPASSIQEGTGFPVLWAAICPSVGGLQGNARRAGEPSPELVVPLYFLLAKAGEPEPRSSDTSIPTSCRAFIIFAIHETPWLHRPASSALQPTRLPTKPVPTLLIFLRCLSRKMQTQS